MAKKSQPRAQSLGERYPNIRILDDTVLVLNTEGELHTYREHLPSVRPMMIIDTLKSEHKDPARLGALWEEYERNFKDANGLDYTAEMDRRNILMPEGMPPEVLAQMQQHTRASRIGETLNCGFRDARDIEASTGAVRDRLIDDVYKEHRARVEATLMGDAPSGSVEQRLSIKATAAAGEIKPVMRANKDTRIAERTALEQALNALPAPYLALLDAAHTHVIAVPKLGHLTGDPDRVAGASQPPTGHILINSPAATALRTTPPKLREILFEEVVHTLDIGLNFSTRDAWKHATQELAADTDEAKMATLLLQRYYAHTGKRALQPLEHTHVELLSDIATLEHMGKPTLNHIVKQAEKKTKIAPAPLSDEDRVELALAERIKQHKSDPKALIAELMPQLAEQYEQFERETAEKAATLHTDTPSATSHRARATRRPSGDGEGHGGKE